MFCLARKSPQHNQKEEVLKKPNTVGRPRAVATALLTEYSLLSGTDLLSTSCQAVIHGAPNRATGKKKALVIGINYRGMKGELNGCINDAKHVTEWLQEQGFSVTQMTDDTPHKPTRDNMLAAMRALVVGTSPGDALWFSYSGHGSHTSRNSSDEADHQTETLVPLDYASSGMIEDNTVWNTLVKPLPKGVALHGIMDCCHSGTGMDLPFEYKGENAGCWKMAHAGTASEADVVIFSGCEDDQTSADLTVGGEGAGALTTAFLDAQRPGATFKSVYDHIHQWMNRLKLTQEPVMSSTNTFDMNQPFDISGIWTKGSAGPTCRDQAFWKDSKGYTCADYLNKSWCDPKTGSHGKGWKFWWGSRDMYAVNGVSAKQACCACKKP